MAEQPDKSSHADSTSADAPSLNAASQSAPSLAAQIDYVRGLAQVAAEEGLSELELESDGFKITLKAPTQAVVSGPVQSVSPAGASLASAPTAPPAKAKPSEALTPLVSPMVGVFYRAPSPNDPNFVEVGDRVERGQTIGLIEAMKVFNEITAENGGVVAEVLVQNGILVETGQPLLLLK